MSAPNLSELDFPALSAQESQSGLLKYSGDDSPYRSANKDDMLSSKSNYSIPTRGAIDFASAVRKMSSQESNMWKYDRNGSADASVGSSRSAHVLASSYNGGQVRGIYGDKYKVGVHTGQLLSGSKLEKQWVMILCQQIYMLYKLRFWNKNLLHGYVLLILLRLQQICTRKCERKPVTMHA